MFLYLNLSIKSLKSNLVRTGLTILGIVIGIATVILVFSAGAGFRSYIDSQVETLGTNTIFIETRVPPTTRSRQSGGGGTNTNSASQAVAITSLKTRDVEDMRKLKNIQEAYGAVLGQKVASFGNIKKNAFVFGSGAERFAVDKGQLAKGRFFTLQEDAASAQVAILGSDIAKDLFGENIDPLGKIVRVGSLNFTIIGVYERRGSFGFSNDDQQIFIPLKTAQKKLLGIDHIFYAIAQVRDPNFAEAAAEDVRLLLRENHDIEDPIKDDFKVQTQAQGLETFSTILSGVTFLLIAIAAISLIVGGVGIMNIMYVVVTERVSEIGLKKSVGAKNRDILYEFLTESVILTVAGGIFGVLLGVLFSYLVALLAKNFGFAWKFSIPFFSIFLSISVSAAIGLIFGVFPARSASKLSPVEALRQE